MISRLSYRLYLPLSLIATACLTALALSLAIAWTTYRNLESDLAVSVQQLSAAIIPGLAPSLKHDDPWLAFHILRGPPGNGDDLELILIDRSLQVFASNRPRRYPVATPVGASVEGFTQLAERLRQERPTRQRNYRSVIANRTVLVTPILVDGESIGDLLASYPHKLFWPRFAEIVRQGAIAMMVVLAVLIPAGWYWGRRMVAPILLLAACMERVKDEPLERIECELQTGDGNEISFLSRCFRDMLASLREKADLENQVVVSERLAAIGRLSAGIAHEINNPLGGMLVAVDTLRSHGKPDSAAARTAALIERGLTQIRDTVSALLVEARPEIHPLSARDLEDVRTLVLSQSETPEITVNWNNRLSRPLPLPSTLVRQVVINLLLNARQAIEYGGHIECTFEVADHALLIEISNDGNIIPMEQLKHLFEPYYGAQSDGSGLGLWVSYQIIEQLRGSISVESTEQHTIFRVELPLEPAGED